MAAATSERGWGSSPATRPVPAEGPSDCTVANVVGEPPPKTNDVAPSCAPAPSWTTSAREPAALTVPLLGSSQDAVPSELPAGDRPPTIRNRSPTARRTSREIGAASCHGSTPASSEGAPSLVLVAWIVPAATEAGEVEVAEVDAPVAEVAALVGATCPGGAGRPLPDVMTTTRAASRRRAPPSTTARRPRMLPRPAGKPGLLTGTGTEAAACPGSLWARQ